MIKRREQFQPRFEGRSWKDIPYQTIPPHMPGCRVLWHAQRLMAEHDQAQRAAAAAGGPLDPNVAYARAAQLVAEEEAGVPELTLGAGLS